MKNWDNINYSLSTCAYDNLSDIRDSVKKFEKIVEDADFLKAVDYEYFTHKCGDILDKLWLVEGKVDCGAYDYTDFADCDADIADITEDLDIAKSDYIKLYTNYIKRI